MRAYALIVSLLVALVWMPGLARADERAELEALRDEVRKEREALAAERKALEEQRLRVDDALQQIERERVTRPSAGALETLPEVSAAEEAERSGIRVEVYGFAQLDAIQDFNRVDPDWTATLRPSKIPVNCPEDPGCGNDGETIVSVRQSRFGVKGFTPTPVGDIDATFEFDLFGVGDDAGETTFRLRHAYGQLGPILAGQTWSLFMDEDVYPNVIDYWGPSGQVNLRNPQLRFTPLNRDGLLAAVAIESPSSALDQGKIDTQELGLPGDFSPWNNWPDFTGRLRMDGSWGHVQLSGILRVLGFEIRAANGGNPDGHELGYAGSLGGTFKLFQDDSIMWQVTGGRGFASYMNDGGTDLTADDNDLTSAEAVLGLGWQAYYNRQWAERWTSAIGFSEHRQFTTGGQDDSAFATGQYGSVNVLFRPTPHMFVGPEFIWGRRENKGDRDNMDNRVQVSFHYDFGGTIFGRRVE